MSIMPITTLHWLFVILCVNVLGKPSNASRTFHKEESSHYIKHTEARLSHLETNIESSYEQTLRPPRYSATYREEPVEIPIVETDKDVEHDRLIRPSVSIVEHGDIKPSDQPNGPTHYISQGYPGGFEVPVASDIHDVPTRKQVCDIKQSPHGEITANCSSRELRSVPADLPHNITELDLSRNLLDNISNNAFTIYSNLTLLNLNFNNISCLDVGSFGGLTKLTTLYMTGNILKSTKAALPPSLFSDLISLETLVIEQNKFAEYPDWIFPPLKRLEKLAIDSNQFLPFFGPGFQHLKNLNFLQIDSRYFRGGQCYIKRLESQTFTNLQNSTVKTLMMNKCKNLKKSSIDVFEPLTSLSVLELSQNQLGIQQALEMLQPFTGRNMSSIIMKSVGYPGNASYYKELVITNNTLQYLGRICVSEVSLRDNGIVWLDGSLISMRFSDCIRNFDASENDLAGDARMLFKMQSFKILSDFRIGLKTPRLGNQDFLSKGNRVLYDIKVTLKLPPKLTYLDLTGGVGGDLEAPFIFTCVQNSKLLKTFIFGYNTLTEHLREFHGLENVTSVDLSGQVFFDKKAILSSFPGTENLKLTFNKLRFESPNESKDVFENLRGIHHINLSHNQLRAVPLLPNPSLVKTINLANNEVNTVPTLWDFTSLTHIDLSNNLIGQIDEKVREFLDHAHHERKFTISVEGNPFLCDCENLDFIVWLVETEVVYETQRTFPCMRGDGTMTNAKDVADRYYIEMRPCNGKLNLAVTVILFIVLIMAIVITYFVGRNPTRVRNVIMKMLGFGVRFLTPFDFEFTLYVGYCQEDVPFVFRSLRPALERGDTKLFLHDRDVLPGEPIADGVIDGVNSSWKVVLVVSYEFLNDPWSDFVMSTAFYSMTDLIPERILVLLVGGVQVEELPEILLSAVDEEFILCADQFQGDQLWTRLREVANVEQL